MKIRVDVVDSNGQALNGLFDSQADADAWIAAHKDDWGHDASPAVEAVLNPDGSELTPARPAEAQNYTLTQTDVSQTYSDIDAIEQGLKYQQVGARAIAMLTAVNLEKQMDAATLTKMAGNSMMMLAITLVGNGALKTGRDIFLSQGQAFYTADEMARIVKPINDSGLVQ